MFQKFLSFSRLLVRRSDLLRNKHAMLALVLLLSLLLCGTGHAGSSRDMEVLRLFFEEKDFATSTTRTAKPVSRIAENVTIVTAKEIEAMNAHTVAEVLNRVTGVFVNFSQGAGTMGSASLFHVQGSDDLHMLVLVDGIPWNSMSGRTAETNSIPVSIIDRIEIIKGPASSSWGSALGGVIHIITKAPGYAAGPEANLRVSYGRHNTQDHRAQVSGRAGRMGYYLYGGRQRSDGPDSARDFENTGLYSRFSYAVSGRINLGLNLGYTRPETGLGDYPAADITSSGANRNFWAQALLDATLSRELTFSLRAFRFQQKASIKNDVLGQGFLGSPGELYQKSVYDESLTGGSARLVWEKKAHTAVFGADVHAGDLDQTINSGRFLQSMDLPPKIHTRPDERKTGIYVNDTLVMGRWSITPGLRYDHNTITGSLLSPSLGLTYRMGKETILRVSVARGFTSPPLSWTSGGALFLDPNDSLEEEIVWSYQAGMETAALRYLWLKTTLFRHEIDDIFELEPTASGRKFVNQGRGRRQGAEIEIQTLPFYCTTLRAGAAYVRLDPANDFGAKNIYAGNVGITYDNPGLIRAELFGHYIHWDAQASPVSSYGDVIWDLNISRRLYEKEDKITMDLFLTGHNIFNGNQYLVPENRNAGRWFEAGLKTTF